MRALLLGALLLPLSGCAVLRHMPDSIDWSEIDRANAAERDSDPPPRRQRHHRRRWWRW